VVGACKRGAVKRGERRLKNANSPQLSIPQPKWEGWQGKKREECGLCWMLGEGGEAGGDAEGRCQRPMKGVRCRESCWEREVVKAWPGERVECVECRQKDAG
jgi:hypothetical protein